jgi:hypothetical protein
MTITATSDNQILKSNIRIWAIGLKTFATGSLPRSGLVQREIMEYQADSSGSLQFDPRKLDHLGPFLSIRGYEFSELVGRHRHQYHSHVLQAATLPLHQQAQH